MTPDRWSDLEALAEKATPGPMRVPVAREYRDELNEADAAYIAAASPDTILSLIREARRSEALTEEVANLEERLRICEEGPYA